EGDDSHIHFEPVVKLPEKIEVKTGEEDEDILFEARGKLYRFVSSEWKEKGVGVLKILQHKESKKTRLLMRRDQVLKICCNHIIEPSLSLQPMAKSEGKAWVWYALDFSEDEGKMEQLAVRYSSSSCSFADWVLSSLSIVAASCSSVPRVPTFTVCFCLVSATVPSFTVSDFTTDDDVIFVGEDKPTEEQVAAARKYLLPDCFYLYEKKPPCPGCIGCEDGELKKTKRLKVRFVFGSGTSVDFSSLASSGKSDSFSWKTTTPSGPFKFAGAGQKLFGGGAAAPAGRGDDEADGDDAGVVPSDDIHFEPVIPLPELVKVKTGEEDWTPLFCHRAKLYKFDKDLSQWKERGVGDIKILGHNTKQTAEEFKTTFVKCQEKLRQINTLTAKSYTQLGCRGSIHHTEALDVAGQGMVTPSSYFQQGDRGNIYHTKALDVAGQDTISATSYSQQGDRGNIYHTKALDVAGQDTISATSYSQQGDRGNIYHTKALDVAGEDTFSATSYSQQGDRGNIYHTKALDVAGQDTISATSYSQQGDRGNIYHTKALDVAGQDAMTMSSYTPLGGRQKQEIPHTFDTQAASDFQ
ncbi:unnamed protein product, partial [Candidula unifasciata]